MTHVRKKFVLACLVVLGLFAVGTAEADPMPGYDLDPHQLEARMDACMAGQMSPQDVLMGWINFRNGAKRHWRCSSLKHMILDVQGRRDNNVHDPYVNVADFMRCVDKVVTGGFPRPGDLGNTKLIYQYQGTSRQAVVVVNDETGDIVTIYTSVADDWTGCAQAL